MNAESTSPPARTPSLLWHSVVAALLCFPIGIMAVIFSLNAEYAAKQGDKLRASQWARRAVAVQRFTLHSILLVLAASIVWAWLK